VAERRIDIYINEEGWIVDVLGFPEDTAGWFEHLELLAHALEVGVTPHPEATSGDVQQFRSPAGTLTYTERITVVVDIDGTYVWSSHNQYATRALLQDVLNLASGGMEGFAIFDGSGTGLHHIPIGEA